MSDCVDVLLRELVCVSVCVCVCVYVCVCALEGVVAGVYVRMAGSGGRAWLLSDSCKWQCIFSVWGFMRLRVCVTVSVSVSLCMFIVPCMIIAYATITVCVDLVDSSLFQLNQLSSCSLLIFCLIFSLYIRNNHAQI